MGDVLATVDVRRRRFTVEEYYRMAETGILTERDRVELIDGEIVEMAPIGHRHALCVAELTNRLLRLVGERAFLWPRNPVRLFADTEPQPDVTLLRGPSSRYATRPPEAADVVLLIEVAETSYRYDRTVKVPIHARAGIGEVWIVDLNQDAVEVLRDPTPRGYASEQRAERGDSISPASLPDASLILTEFLPPA